MDVEVIRSGVVTDQKIRDLFSGETGVEYYHFRHGACNLEDGPEFFVEE